MDTFEQDLGLRTISLHDLWDIFVRKFILMALAAVLAVGGAFAYQKFMLKPQYESTATLYLVNRGGEEEPGMTTYNSFSLSLKLVNDCNHLLKSHAVLDQVISSLNLDMTYEELYRSVTVVNPEETRILEATVIADSPEQAKKIVDEICEVGVRKIEQAMGFEQAKLYEYGVMDGKPCNSVGLTTYAILAFAAAAAVYLFFLVRFLLDDRLRTEEDIQRMLGLSVLGDIPDASNPKRGRAYYKGYYGKRGYGKTPYGQMPTAPAQPRGQLPVDPLPQERGPAHGAARAGEFGQRRMAGSQASAAKTGRTGR